MRSLIKGQSTLLILFLSLFLADCAIKPLQAPCDENATYCGMKTKINAW